MNILNYLFFIVSLLINAVLMYAEKMLFVTIPGLLVVWVIRKIKYKDKVKEEKPWSFAVFKTLFISSLIIFLILYLIAYINAYLTVFN